MVDSAEHDDLLFEMLKECKTLPVFLNHVFGFLNRRTDFYHIASGPNSPVGLPPGLAEEIIKKTFYKWKPTDKCEGTPQINESTTKPNNALNLPIKPKLDDFSTSDSYNGATYDFYSWSQTLLEVDIAVKIPENTTIKDVTVKIQVNYISVRLKNGTILLDGELCEKCKHNEAIWSLHKKILNIHLDKSKEIWWNCLIKCEPKLDLNTLDCSRPFEELSEEAQAKLEELQWNQERKRQGLPTSEEMAMHSMLEQSWNSEGSPFQGPFNPSTVKFN